MHDLTVEDLEAAIIGSGAEALLRLFRKICEYKEIMKGKHSVTIPIHKKKDKLNCSNYGGHNSKIFFSSSPLSCKGHCIKLLKNKIAKRPFIICLEGLFLCWGHT